MIKDHRIVLKNNDDSSDKNGTVTAKLTADERGVVAELSTGDVQLGEVFIELWDFELRVYLSDRRNLEHGQVRPTRATASAVNLGQMFVLNVLEDHVTATLARQ